jgi:carboxyl-terminal processing protease
MSEFSKKARGLEATILTISVLRNGNKINDIAVKRGTIYTPNTPYYGLLKNEVGYIVLSSFTENAAKNVQNALLELKQKSNLKGLVLDLRFNTGGLLNEAVQLASLFIPKGSLVVNTRGTNKSLEKSYKTTQSPIDTDIPLIVLINETSASASEIVAGSLQDYDRAVILGSKSFGKGLVQHVFDLPYGAKVKLTTSKYYLPSGRCIQSKFYQNGKEQELADSLKENFKTTQGRIVVDAAGIIPDISNNNELFYSLLKDPVYTTLKYNFAVQFTNQNKVADPANFQFTDAQFIDFIKYAENADLSQLDKNLNFLQEIESSSKEEGFKKVLDLLPELKKKKLISTLELIKKFPKEIRFDLQQRIVLHTHFQKGRIINSISFDPLIEQACSTITNKKYLSILQKN